MGLRSRNIENAEVRSGRPFPVLVGHMGRFSWRLLGCARLQRGSGRKLLRGRSGQRTRAKIPATTRRESGFSGRQTCVRSVEIMGAGTEHKKHKKRKKSCRD